MRIAVIADTHGHLRGDLEDQIFSCDAVFHAGDFDTEDVYSRMSQRPVPFYCVRGNSDWWCRGGDIPESLSVEYEGVRIFMTHCVEDVPALCRQPQDLIICGHTHSYSKSFRDGAMYLNPGSTSKPRDGAAGYCILNLFDGHFEEEHILIEAAAPPVSAQSGQLMDRLVRQVIKMNDNGSSVAEIAARLNEPPARVENIVRMYLKHPGISIDAIVARL
ncbi:MAG: YfcE family phosphodiesterase [Lachnospiraceae bacterium]|nr:YfcE family phosphodiesterase [Lachnospiraceae bacterium]